MKNAGFLNLPVWKEKLQEILMKIGHNDLLKLPLLGRENSEGCWQAFDREDFFSVVQTGIAFCGKKSEDFPQKLITSDLSLALSRLEKGLAKNTFYSGAIGGTFPFIKILSDCSISKPVKFFVQNDAFSGFVLSTMEQEGKSFDEAVCDGRWNDLGEDNSNFSLHGIVCHNRLLLQIAEIFGCFVKPDRVPFTGINSLEKVDISVGKELGMSIRLLGVAEYNKVANILKVISEPCLIPEKFFLAQARGGSEIIYVKTEDGQSHVYACPGASHESVVRGIVKDIDQSSLSEKNDLLEVNQVEDFDSKFYLRFNVINMTKTLSELLNLLTLGGIEVEKLYQPKVSYETAEGLSLVIFTSKTKRKVLEMAINKISEKVKLASLKACFRIIDRG